jgi:hypothetical protein
VSGDVGDVVGNADHPVRPDQVGVAARVLGELLLRVARDLVLGPDLAVDITEEAIWELLVVGERQVLFRRVERRAEDDGIELVEALDLVTKALTLNRSTRGGGLGVPPEQHPLAGEVAEARRLAVLVGQFEVGRFRSWTEHCLSVAGDHAGGATALSLTQLPWNPYGTRCGSGTWAT